MRDDCDPEPPEGYDVDYEGAADEAWGEYLAAVAATESEEEERA